MQTCKPNGENTPCFMHHHSDPWDFESPIIDATNEKESWLEAWTAHIEILQTQACYRTHWEVNLAMTTCKSDTWAYCN